MARIVMVLVGNIKYDGRVRKEIHTLVEAGHHVELVVSDFSKDGSGGGDLGIKIHYVPVTLWPTPALNFVSQMLFNRRAASIIRRLSPTHIHCHDLSSLAAGVWAKHSTGASLIFDAHELMPESMGGIRESVWGWIEKQCIKSCDYIVMPEKNRIAYFQHKYSSLPSTLLLENFPSKSEIPTCHYDIFREVYPIENGQRIILHTGVLHPKRHVEELIESMTLCGNDFVLIMLGRSFKGYGESLRAKTEALGLAKRIFFHDPVPRVEILNYMASCDIGTAFYRNTNLNNYYCASNKVYEYIALDKPVVTNNYPGLLETVERFAQGVCLDEITPKQLADAFVRACEPRSVTPGARKFFWEDERSVLSELYAK
jgi:glycosyltransferase involved in cell wall biosynthesis